MTQHLDRHVGMIQAYDNFLTQMGGKTSIELKDRCDKNCMNEKCLRARHQLISHKNKKKKP